MSVSIIDLFAGPGGLGEGFSSEIDGEHPFKIALSVEMDPHAHKTLSLRAFYRHFVRNGKAAPLEYYQYVSGSGGITRETLFNKFPDAAMESQAEALCAELGSEKPNQSESFFDQKIHQALDGEKNWLLIGGPPCQAYSLVGRARTLGRLIKDNGDQAGREEFNNDPRHKLYRQYLRILAVHSPAVFVMENVKGILSSKLDGKLIFPEILSDLKDPSKAADHYGWKVDAKHKYKIVSFVTGTEPTELSAFLIRSEEYGIPQCRHRVILLGIRDDIWKKLGGKIGKLSPAEKQMHLCDVIKNIPKLRSGLSKEEDTLKSWRDAIDRFSKNVKVPKDLKLLIEQARAFRADAHFSRSYSGKYIEPSTMQDWYVDKNLTTCLNHQTRAHIVSDLHRYLFAAIYTEKNGNAPRLCDFPDALLPKHSNVIREGNKSKQKFTDRFKVQKWNAPSSTVTSHISKDGHYFIHPDPVQCRSLTVREAARLQTFPDNYFFEGNRTQQYHQVGNAVPPYLAKQLAEIVLGIFRRIGCP